MAIEVKCPGPQCGKTYRVKDELAGKKVRCARCKAVIEIPDAPAAPAEDELQLDGSGKTASSRPHPARLTCTNCGALLGVRDAICPQCGGDVRSGVTVMKITPEQKKRMGITALFTGGQKKGVAPRRRRTGPSPLAVGLLVVVILGAIVGGVLWAMSAKGAGGEGGSNPAPQQPADQ